MFYITYLNITRVRPQRDNSSANIGRFFESSKFWGIFRKNREHIVKLSNCQMSKSFPELWGRECFKFNIYI